MTQTVENEKAAVKNVDEITLPVNKVAKQTANDIFEQVIKLDNLTHIADDLAVHLVTKLRDESFMTIDLELTDEQRDKLCEFLKQATQDVRNRYISKLKKDQRTKDQVQIVEKKLCDMVDESLRQIGQEVNRGAIISSTAVSADTKNEKHNKIELQYHKGNGDITIPTKGVFISTNCIEIIKQSAEVDVSSYAPEKPDAEEKEEKEDAKPAKAKK